MGSWRMKVSPLGSETPTLLRKASDHPLTSSLSQHRAKTETGFVLYDQMSPATRSPQVPDSST